MAGTKEREGGCLCGAVRLTAVPLRDALEVCHCGKCRRWSGGPFLSVLCDGLAVTKGEAVVSAFRSSEHGERLFCRNCGSNIGFRMLDGSMFAVAFGAFDDPAGLEFTTQIFIDDKPASYSFAEETRKLTGAEVFAQFGASQEG